MILKTVWCWGCEHTPGWEDGLRRHSAMNNTHRLHTNRRAGDERPTTDLTSQWAGEDGASWQLPSSLSPSTPRLHSAGLPGDDGGGCRGAVAMAVPAGAPLEGQVGRAASTNCQRPARAAEEPGRSLFCLIRCINREHTHTHTHTHTHIQQMFTVSLYSTYSLQCIL